MERSWTDSYYDSVEHYFWTSERLGHKPDPDRKLKRPAEVFARLKRLEEPLNHLLGLFFALAPPRFVVRLFEQHASISIDELPTYLGGDVQALCQSDSATQPDFAFDCPNCFLTIEAKVDSKSSIEQVAKYALLHQRADAQRPRRALGLLYLSRSAPHDLFAGSWKSWDDVKACVANQLPLIEKSAFRTMTEEARRSVLNTLERMTISSFTYKDLRAAAVSASAELGDGEAESVLKRLYQGLCSELTRRSLA